MGPAEGSVLHKKEEVSDITVRVQPTLLEKLAIYGIKAHSLRN